MSDKQQLKKKEGRTRQYVPPEGRTAIMKSSQKKEGKIKPESDRSQKGFQEAPTAWGLAF